MPRFGFDGVLQRVLPADIVSNRLHTTMCVSQKRKVHKSLRSKVYGETPAVETGLDKLHKSLT